MDRLTLTLIVKNMWNSTHPNYGIINPMEFNWSFFHYNLISSNTTPNNNLGFVKCFYEFLMMSSHKLRFGVATQSIIDKNS